MHLYTETDGDYGEIFCGHHCEVNKGYGNLKSFPFKKKMDCHVLDFWHSKYADMLDGSDESYDKALNLWSLDKTMGPIRRKNE